MKQLKRFLSPVLTLLILALAAFYAHRHWDELAVLKQVAVYDLILLAVLHVVFFHVTGLTFALLVTSVGARIRYGEWLALTFLGNFVNYLLPTRPGAAIKAVYLKTRRDVPLARFSAVLAAQAFLLLMTAGVLGALLLIWLWRADGFFSWLLWGVCLGAIGGASLPLAVRLPAVRRQNRLADALRTALEGFATIRSQRRHLIWVCATVLAQYLVAAVMTVIAYDALGHPIPLRAALMVGVFTSLSNFFTFTPNNLGVQEVVVAYLFTLTGVDFTLGLLGAGLLRAVHVGVTLLLTPPLTWWLLGHGGMSLRDLLPRRDPPASL